MPESKKSFRHESLQDRETVQGILKALTKGLNRGELRFSDDDGEILLHPEGLLTLRVSASQDDNRHRLDIRVSWQTDDGPKEGKVLNVE